MSEIFHNECASLYVNNKKFKNDRNSLTRRRSTTCVYSVQLTLYDVVFALLPDISLCKKCLLPAFRVGLGLILLLHNKQKISSLIAAHVILTTNFPTGKTKAIAAGLLFIAKLFARIIRWNLVNLRMLVCFSG